jgi:hypothetical protein
MNYILVNNDIAYHQLIRRIQNTLKPTNFAVAVQEFGKKIWVFVPVYLQAVQGYCCTIWNIKRFLYLLKSLPFQQRREIFALFRRRLSTIIGKGNIGASRSSLTCFSDCIKSSKILSRINWACVSCFCKWVRSNFGNIYFWIGSPCNNSAAYLFLPKLCSIFTPSGFWAGCHPPRIYQTLPDRAIAL